MWRGRPSSTVISTEEGGGQKNHSDSQRKRGPGCRLGPEGRRSREAVGVGRAEAGLPRRQSRGCGARRGQARGPARGGPAAVAPRPAPRPQAPPAAKAPREARRGTAAAAASAGSLRPAGGAFQAGGHRGPAQEGASQPLQKEMGRARRRSRRKNAKIGPRRLPGAALRLPPGHAALAPLGWAARVPAAVPDARSPARGRCRRLGTRGSSAATAQTET